MKYSLQQLYLASLILIVTTGLIALISVGFLLYKSATNHALEDYKTVIIFLGNTIGNPFWIHQELTHIPGVMDNFLTETAKYPGVLFIRIVDSKTGKIIQAADRKEVNLKIENLPSFEKNVLIRNGKFRKKSIKELSLKSRAGDRIWIGGSFENARQEILRSIGFVAGLLIIFFLTFTALVVFTMKTLIGKNVETLIDGFGRVGKEDYGARLPDSKNIEAQEIFSSFNFFVQRLEENKKRGEAISKMKSEFISIVAHQLRTPLSAIKWVIKMVLDGDAGELTNEQRELLNKGYLSNERIIRLVNDLLNVSRIEEGKFGFNFEPADFQEVLNVAISNVDSLVTKNHQELMIKKPSQLPKIFLDKERMIMVMQNLLSNAIKYTPEHGKIEIVIEVDKQFLHVKIKDQGVGIPAADQSKIFSKFFRAANVVKLETEGTGLGLFMVKNIIEKHNGQISLKSEEGKGTEVSFFIPINKATNL